MSKLIEGLKGFKESFIGSPDQRRMEKEQDRIFRLRKDFDNKYNNQPIREVLEQAGCTNLPPIGATISLEFLDGVFPPSARKVVADVRALALAEIELHEKYPSLGRTWATRLSENSNVNFKSRGTNLQRGNVHEEGLGPDASTVMAADVIMGGEKD